MILLRCTCWGGPAYADSLASLTARVGDADSPLLAHKFSSAWHFNGTSHHLHWSMRSILQKRALRYVFAANVISMLGSGMNSAAVAWYILQATHSEMALGTFAVLQTIPAMLMLPFTGVIIDREDRRRLVMMLDAARAVVILAVSILAFRVRPRCGSST